MLLLGPLGTLVSGLGETIQGRMSGGLGRQSQVLASPHIGPARTAATVKLSAQICSPGGQLGLSVPAGPWRCVCVVTSTEIAPLDTASSAPLRMESVLRMLIMCARGPRRLF